MVSYNSGANTKSQIFLWPLLFKIIGSFENLLVDYKAPF